MEVKLIFKIHQIIFSSTAKPINPFNPFQTTQQQQSYQNWTFPETQTNFNNGFGSPPLATNGFYYANNVSNGVIQPSPFGGKAVFGNPFMVSEKKSPFDA